MNIPGFPTEMARPPSYNQLLREMATKNKEIGPYSNLKQVDRQNHSMNKKAINNTITFEELKFASKEKEVRLLNTKLKKTFCKWYTRLWNLWINSLLII